MDYLKLYFVTLSHPIVQIGDKGRINHNTALNLYLRNHVECDFISCYPLLSTEFFSFFINIFHQHCATSAKITEVVHLISRVDKS